MPDENGVFRTVQRISVVSYGTPVKVVVTGKEAYEADMHKPASPEKDYLEKAPGMVTYPLGRYLGKEETKNLLQGGGE
jgi:hypothetical protein